MSELFYFLYCCIIQQSPVSKNKNCISFPPIFSVERYDLEEDKWTRVARLNSGRANASVAVVNDVLYVIGGTDGREDFNTCEKYDVRTNTWSDISSKYW